MATDHRRGSPLRERPTSPKRRREVDYGHDAENHTRHIARSKQLITFAGEEGTPRAWSWVLSALVHARFNGGLGCHIDLLDQIVYGVDGTPEALFYTAKSGGTVVGKSIGEDEGYITLANAVARHLRPPKRYLDALQAIRELNSAVAFTPGGEAVAIKSVDVEKIRKGQATAPAGTEVLVLLVPTKARAAPCAELLLSLQHTFELEAGSAKPLHLSYRLAVFKGEFRRVPCKSSTLNQHLRRACNSIIEWIEAYSQARVLNLVLEYVEDHLGQLWLVRSAQCSTTRTVPPYNEKRRSPSPMQSKASRLEIAKSVAGELSILRYGHGIGESAPTLVDHNALSPTGSVPGRRPFTTLSSAEVSSKGSQGSIDAEEWGFELHDSSPTNSQASSRRLRTTSDVASMAEKARRSALEGKHGSDEDAITFRGFAAQGERDPRIVGRTAAAGRALGSSQLGGTCHGDFCDVDLLDQIQQRSKFEREETGNYSLTLRSSASGHVNVGGVTVTGGQNSDSRKMRKGILQLDESTLQDHGVLPDPGDTKMVASAKGVKGGKRRRRRGRKCGESGGQSKGGYLETGSVEHGHENARWNEIPLSWVIRGRQERHLIDQQLRRYRRGDKEPFVNHLSGLGESSVSFGALFPAIYYQRVRVCDSCYRVYTLVDSARTESVKRLDARAASPRGGVWAGRKGTPDAHDLNQPLAKRARGPEESADVDIQAQVQTFSNAGRSSYDAFNGMQVGAQGHGTDPSFEGGWRREDHEERDREGASKETLALMRAQLAINGLSRDDICELRSFSKPPAAVNMVVAALMIALVGDGESSAAGWLTSKKLMMNVDKIFASIAGLDLDSLRASQIRKLEAYARNPAFRPEVIACVSLPASRLCAWVLGVLDAHRWRNGRGHPRTDALRTWRQRDMGTSGGADANPANLFDGDIQPTVQAGEEWRPQQHIAAFRSSNRNRVRPGALATRDAVAIGPAVFPYRRANTATISNSNNNNKTNDKNETRSRSRISRRGSGTSHLPHGGATFLGSRDSNLPTLPQAWVPPGAGPAVGVVSTGGTGPGSLTRAGTALSLRDSGRGMASAGIADTGTTVEREQRAPQAGRPKGLSRVGRAAARGRQERIAGRLADATAAAPDPCGFERDEFVCSDGITVMPYAVVGKTAASERGGNAGGDYSGGGREGDGVLSFIAIHDFFDNLEKTFLLLKPLVLRHSGCQVLCFNSPGQAGTQLPPEPEGLLTNDWVADRLDELMQHVDNMGLMPLSDRPFHLLGIGNGASIASAFAYRHASRPRWKPTVRALVCINGFATVDAQLAAVLHSAQGAFRCFPPERPDLPVTFWSRFIFSDGYLKSVGSDLAINIYCAVANPLGAEGMLRIVKGALRSRDLRKDLPSIALPLVLLQSTDNLLVNAANVDPFLEGRRPRHVWSHQLRLGAGGFSNNSAVPTPDSTRTSRPKTTGHIDRSRAASSCLGPAGERALFESLSAGREGAFVAWVKGGHEVRQECKRAVTDLLNLLAAPWGQPESFFQRGPQPQRAPGGGEKRLGIASKSQAATANVTAEAAADSEHPLCMNAQNCGIVADPKSTDVARADAHGRSVLEAPNMERAHETGDREMGEETVGVDGNTRNGDENIRSGQKYGYASMRKIREQDPLPMLPRRLDGRELSPMTSPRRKSAVSRARPRAITAPASTGSQPGVRLDHADPERTARGQSERDTRLLFPFDAMLHQDTAVFGLIVGGESEKRVVPLEAAVSDFDAALREHRSKRRGQLTSGSTTAPSPSSQRERAVDFGNNAMFLSGIMEPRAPAAEALNSNPSSWFDKNEVRWATVPEPEGETVTLSASQWADSEEAKGKSEGYRNNDTTITTAPAGPGSALPQHLCQEDDYSEAIVGRHVTDHTMFMKMEAANVDKSISQVDSCAKDMLASQELDKIGHVSREYKEQPAGSTPPPSAAREHPEGSSTNETVLPRDQSHTSRPSDVGRGYLVSSPPATLAFTTSVNSHESNDLVVATSITPDTVEEKGIMPINMISGHKSTNVAVSPSLESHAVASLTEPEAVRDTADPGETAKPENGELIRGMFPAAVAAMESPDAVSTYAQRSTGNWMTGMTPDDPIPPPPLSVTEAEAHLVEKVEQLQSMKKALEQEKKIALNQSRSERFGKEQATRAAGFAKEDQVFLEQEELRLAEVRWEADLGRMQRSAEFEETDEALVRSGAAMPLVATRSALKKKNEESAFAAADPPLGKQPPKVCSPGASLGATPASECGAVVSVPVRGMRPQQYLEAEDLPEGLRRAVAHQPADQVLDKLESLAARANAAGRGANIQEFEQVEQQQRARQVERLGIFHGHTEEERQGIKLAMTIRLQMFSRSAIARHRVARLNAVDAAIKKNVGGVILIQALVRGHLSRNRARRVRRQALDEAVLGGRATMIQKVYRGRLGRFVYTRCLKDARVRVLQRAARGFLGRRVAGRKRALLARFAARASSATKIQSAWRGKVARDAYLRTRCSWLASREVQRVYRGHLGRRATERRREWQAAGPGAERLKLGMRMIEDTKVAFEKQQGEIAALDRAQEKAEARVSSIHHQLTTSEAELSVLEGEMSEIDQLERELVQLTHERDLLNRGITGAAGLPKTGTLGDIPEVGIQDGMPGGVGWGGGGGGGGGGSGGGGGPGGRGTLRSRKAEAYALEMQIQLKRAEREQRRQQLSAEFASTFADVADKKRQLDRLSAAVADIESTRQRKSREFGHMQRNLMDLLSEQKRELDHVREKGVQLETAAATSAAAAASTAQRARDHEAKASAMYGQTEELMKFQFMSMSLSYFSSLNMMKQMRDINADTTTAAVAGSADAAAAAAASAAAASIPSLKGTEHLGGDAVTRALAKRKDRVETTRKEIEEAEESQRHPFPSDMSLWTMDDVCRWLDTLQLGEYKQAFREGKVDGSFLAELRESDLVDSIGMEHKLHLKKLILARQKLTPLSSAEVSMASSVRREESATATREGIPDLDTAFSQARHGKRKRLEETLNLGFDIETEDESGNTLLLVAVQQLQMGVVEFLISRGANVNHTNTGGNAALHFAMSYDTSGKMGEFLINNGADDSIENKAGLSAYDGI